MSVLILCLLAVIVWLWAALSETRKDYKRVFEEKADMHIERMQLYDRLRTANTTISRLYREIETLVEHENNDETS